MISLKLIFKSLGFAISGLWYVIKTQNNARFHLLATMLVIGIGLWLKLELGAWCILVIAIGLVWITECFNTAIEKFFDLLNPSPHPLVKHGKDSSAAAVLVSAFLSVILGILVLVPPLIDKVKTLWR